MRTLLLSLPLLLLACGGSAESEPVTTTSAADTGTADTTPVTTADAATVAEDVAPPPPCAAGCATLSGKVMRKALTKPQNGGKGSVYVAVFDKDPVVDRAGAKLVGKAVVENADMTADTASVPYAIAELTPRPSPYFVVAFLDDNKNASGTAPGPDKGDLVSLDGISAPKVTLAAAGTVTLDLSLNAVLPF